MNLIINTYCNFNCPYCFADNEIATCNDKNMTPENFEEILCFMKANNERNVRILGGEPTLHPYFGFFLNTVANDSFFDSIHIFSNMHFSKDIRDVIYAVSQIKRISILPNFNNVSNEKIAENVKNNIKFMVDKNIISTIGVNLFKPNMNLNFLFDLIDEIENEYPNKIDCIRWAITVPNLSTKDNFDNYDIKEYFHSFYSLLKHFFSELNKRNLKNSLDCNSIPLCVFNCEEVGELVKLNPTLFGYKPLSCDFVLDVNPKLEAFQCFGMSDQGKTIINRNKSIMNVVDDIYKQNENIINKKLFKECEQCNIFSLNGNKSCSCLAYRK